MTAEARELIDGQYADRPHLRPVLDAVLAALPGLGPATGTRRPGPSQYSRRPDRAGQGSARRGGARRGRAEARRSGQARGWRSGQCPRRPGQPGLCPPPPARHHGRPGQARLAAAPGRARPRHCSARCGDGCRTDRPGLVGTHSYQALKSNERTVDTRASLPSPLVLEWTEGIADGILEPSALLEPRTAMLIPWRESPVSRDGRRRTSSLPRPPRSA
jgi:hypothetical protein